MSKKNYSYKYLVLLRIEYWFSPIVCSYKHRSFLPKKIINDRRAQIIQDYQDVLKNIGSQYSHDELGYI